MTIQQTEWKKNALFYVALSLNKACFQSPSVH